jgi:hypothetical protein
MQSSVRSETPRGADLRSLSSTSVHVNREVTVVSSQAPSPAVKRARYSQMASTQNDHDRPQTSPTPATAVAGEAPLNRWNSQSRESNRSSVRYSRGTFQQSSQDKTTLENNQESMKALADFLMTKEPPLNNWISIPSDDERSLSSLKKSAFKLFRRRKSKKPKAPRFLQLPDSAVSAKTRSGARHIAISIPIEHDHIEKPKEPQAPLLQPPFQRKPSADRHDRSAVTILKPVAEVRESGSSYLPSVTKSGNSETELGQPQPESIVSPPAAEILGPDAAKASENYYASFDEQQKSPGTEFSSKKFDPARSQKSYIPVSPINILRQDSQRSDPRHSGGTAYSTVSLGTFQGHSRGPSSVSTAPSTTMISSMKLGLPPHNSSMSKAPTAIKDEPAQTTKLVNKVPRDEPLSTVLSGVSESATSQTAPIPSPPLVFSTAKAEAVRSFSGSGEDGPQIVRSLTPKSQGLSPAPSKELPDLPSIQDAGLTRAKTAPPLQAKYTAMAQLKAVEARHARDGTDDALRVTRQSRHDRVKARKQRDIDLLRSKSATRSPLTEAALPPNTSQDTSPKAITTAKISTPLRNPKMRSPSQELARRKAANSLSPIMLVANLAPYTGTVLKSELALKSRKLTAHSSSNSNTIRSAEHTPLHSIDSPLSDSDHVPISGIRSSRRRAGSATSRVLSPTGSMLESRRRERRLKRNLREREKDLDERLRRIERDNRLLMSTLSGIASSFGELSRRVEKGGLGIGMGKWEETGELGEERRMHGELRGMEPVMRELQVLAPRVSTEIVKKVVDEFDEDDGESILL